MTTNRPTHFATRICDECGSGFCPEATLVAHVCAECAARLFGCDPCTHRFDELGTCTQCGWDGSVTEAGMIGYGTQHVPASLCSADAPNATVLRPVVVGTPSRCTVATRISNRIASFTRQAPARACAYSSQHIRIA